MIVNYSHIQAAVEANPDQFQAGLYQIIDQAAGGDAIERTRLLGEWSDALLLLKRAELEPGVLSSARNGLASRLQSLITEHCAATSTSQLSPRGVLTAKFDHNDLLGWMQMVWKMIFKPVKVPWKVPTLSTTLISDTAVISLFSDWGTGLYGAPVIAESIKRMPRCDVVLHLGDTYYTGTPQEINDRLIAPWPARTVPTLNRSLNGNHEMYSGGQGYFSALTTFFQQPSSCFALQNSGWLLACLDTAYEDFDMDPAQVSWLETLVMQAGTRKLILFSHYQPFSYFEDQGTKLQKALTGLLERQRIHAWFWGHEHRLVMYQPHSRWGFKGRCIGNGGIPMFRDNLGIVKGSEYLWVNLLASAAGLPAASVLDGPNFWVRGNPGSYSPHGFVTLEFVGDKAYETYKTPDGVALSPKLEL